MPKIEIDGKLVPVIDCPTCARTIIWQPQHHPCTGWVASCGQRLVNLSECGQADETCRPSDQQS